MTLGAAPFHLTAGLLDAGLAVAGSTISGARRALASIPPSLLYEHRATTTVASTELRRVSALTGVSTRLDVVTPPFGSRPRWSPRRDELAFTGGSWETTRLYLWRPADGAPRAVPNSEGAGPCCWSPGGDRLVFARWTGTGGLHVINVDGSGLVRVTPGAEDTAPDWSSDGRWIVYSSGSGSSGTALAVLDLETGQRSGVTPTSEGVFDRAPRHRPGDTTVVFSRGRFDGGARLWTVGLDGGAPRPLTASVLPFRDETDPVYSPDGRALAFVRSDPDNTRSWLHLADPEGRRAVRVTGGDGRVSSPEWAR